MRGALVQATFIVVLYAWVSGGETCPELSRRPVAALEVHGSGSRDANGLYVASPSWSEHPVFFKLGHTVLLSLPSVEAHFFPGGDYWVLLEQGQWSYAQLAEGGPERAALPADDAWMPMSGPEPPPVTHNVRDLCDFLNQFCGADSWRRGLLEAEIMHAIGSDKLAMSAGLGALGALEAMGASEVGQAGGISARVIQSRLASWDIANGQLSRAYELLLQARNSSLWAKPALCVLSVIRAKFDYLRSENAAGFQCGVDSSVAVLPELMDPPYFFKLATSLLPSLIRLRLPQPTHHHHRRRHRSTAPRTHSLFQLASQKHHQRQRRALALGATAPRRWFVLHGA